MKILDNSLPIFSSSDKRLFLHKMLILMYQYANTVIHLPSYYKHNTHASGDLVSSKLVKTDIKQVCSSYLQNTNSGANYGKRHDVVVHHLLIPEFY